MYSKMHISSADSTMEVCVCNHVATTRGESFALSWKVPLCPFLVNTPLKELPLFWLT